MKKRNRAIFSASQSKNTHLKELFNFVDQADSLSEKSNRTFYLEKFRKNNYNYKEAWRYTEKSGRIIYFQIDYILDSTEFTEVYYLNRGDLICSEEYQKINYSYTEDELKYGGIYYFQSAVPQQVVVLGKKDNFAQPHPEFTILSRFEKRLSELKRHIPMLP
jgi:hypothetical protein